MRSLEGGGYGERVPQQITRRDAQLVRPPCVCACVRVCVWVRACGFVARFHSVTVEKQPLVLPRERYCEAGRAGRGKQTRVVYTQPR